MISPASDQPQVIDIIQWTGRKRVIRGFHVGTLGKKPD
jgi:hypothetical protein